MKITVNAHMPSKLTSEVKFSIRAEGYKVDGPCGIELPYHLFIEFLERLSPDELNGSEYIPAMPIELPHAG